MTDATNQMREQLTAEIARLDAEQIEADAASKTRAAQRKQLAKALAALTPKGAS